MSPALANDGVSSIMVLLAVLLAMMLFAVIRAPEWEGSSGQGHRLAVCAPGRRRRRLWPHRLGDLPR
jgi:hypothetical protein